MTKNLLAAELARILPHAEYVEMPLCFPQNRTPDGQPSGVLFKIFKFNPSNYHSGTHS